MNLKRVLIMLIVENILIVSIMKIMNRMIVGLIKLFTKNLLEGNVNGV